MCVTIKLFYGVAIASGSSVPGIAQKLLIFVYKEATCLSGSYQSAFLGYLLLSAARQIVAAVQACLRPCDGFVVINRAGLLKIPL